jgi:hypothetical protein
MEQAQERTKVLNLSTALSKFLPLPFFRAQERKMLKQLKRKSDRAIDLEFVIK